MAHESYMHTACGQVSKPGAMLARMLDNDPSALRTHHTLFCAHCPGHFEIDEFVWSDDGASIGGEAGV